MSMLLVMLSQAGTVENGILQGCFRECPLTGSKSVVVADR